ncbi:MAG: NUDIX hydrolase [Candidatus Moranbacteria bacterium]|nr:NUDIX hydrolase [Candidatus Moranbacteria bacterium]
MSDITVSKLKKDLIVRYDGGHVLLPAGLQKEIDSYWEELIRGGKRYTRGEVFTVIGKTETDDSIEVTVSRTDFAHNLFCRDIRNPEGYGIRIIHTAALVETSDGKVVFGRMSAHTANPLRYQLCGGGIDDHDIRDGVFDLDHNTKKELREELGIDVDDTRLVLSFSPAYFKEGGPREKMSVIYRVTLSETAAEYRKRYETFAEGLRKAGEDPEFGEIVVFNRNSEELLSFLAREDLCFDEYMRPLFQFSTSKRMSK